MEPCQNKAAHSLLEPIVIRKKDRGRDFCCNGHLVKYNEYINEGWGTGSLPQVTLTYHQQGPVAFT